MINKCTHYMHAPPSSVNKRTQNSHEQEYLAMQKSPPPFIWAVPEEKNILDCEWESTDATFVDYVY